MDSDTLKGIIQSTLFEVVVDVDLTLEVACEGTEHPHRLIGHGDGPAAYLVRPACCSGQGVLQCADRVAYMLAHPEEHQCSICGTMPAVLRFIEL